MRHFFCRILTPFWALMKISSHIDQEVYYLQTGEEAPNGLFAVLNLKSWQSYSQKSVTLDSVDVCRHTWVEIYVDHTMKVWNKKCPWNVLIDQTDHRQRNLLSSFWYIYSCCRAGRELQLKRTSRSRSTGSQPATRCLFLEVSFHFAHSLFHCIIVKYCCCPEFITQNNRYHTIPSNTLR